MANFPLCLKQIPAPPFPVLLIRKTPFKAIFKSSDSSVFKEHLFIYAVGLCSCVAPYNGISPDSSLFENVGNFKGFIRQFEKALYLI